MEEISYPTGELKLIDCLTKSSDSSFREKPYAALNSKPCFKSENLSNYPDYLVDTGRKRGVWPLEILLEQFEREELVREIDYITDYGNRSQFDPPRTISELQSSKYAYFAGVAAGDGGFNGVDTWSIVDGGKSHEIAASCEFIQVMKSLLTDCFGIEKDSIWVNKREDAIELKLSNKWFGRYIRDFFGLPRSYKKGELSRPEIFKSKRNIASFWRGAFDADGHIEKESYRVSIATATRAFAADCIQDFKDMGIDTSFRSCSGVYHVRVNTNDFGTYCRKIGFAHPRKLKTILSKLEKGSRNYVYDGRSQQIIAGRFYDLFSIKNLRVLGLGEQIRSKRKHNDLYQRELAEKLGVSEDQIWAWENEVNATPLSKLRNLYQSKIQVLSHLEEDEIMFKVGKRGNGKSKINMPVRVDSRVDNIASNIIATKDELRIRNKNGEIVDEIESVFGVEVTQEEDKFYSRKTALVQFFKNFYLYEPKFESKDKEQIKNIRNRLETPIS